MSGPGAVTAAGQKNRWGGARVRVPKRESCAANHARAIVSFFRGVRAPLLFPCVLIYPFGDRRHSQPWSSGMMLACHAGDPGSIPGGCTFVAYKKKSKKKRKKSFFGGLVVCCEFWVCVVCCVFWGVCGGC